MIIFFKFQVSYVRTFSQIIILFFYSITNAQPDDSEIFKKLTQSGRWGDYYVLSSNNQFQSIKEDVEIDSVHFIGDKSIKLLEETRPDIVNLSRYSQRPGTDAAEMVQIDVSEVKRRSKITYELISKISKENNQKWIGWRGEVLFDEEFEDQVRGRNFAYLSLIHICRCRRAI